MVESILIKLKRFYNAKSDYFILAVIVSILFLPILRNYFFYDDFFMLGWYRNHDSVRTAILEQFNQGYGIRFLLDVYLWGKFKLFAWNPVPYFVISIIQHYLVTILFYILTMLLVDNKLTAFLASIIFAVAFSHYEVITWITGSNISFVVILYLSSMISFLKWLEGAPIPWYFGSLILLGMALFTGEYAVTLPLILLVMYFCFSPSKSLKKGIFTFGPIFLIVMVYIILELGLLFAGTSEGTKSGGFYPGVHMLPAFSNLAYLLIPNVNIARIANYLTSISPLLPRLLSALSYLMVILFLGVTIWIVFWGARLQRFFLLWVYLSFSPFTLWVNSDLSQAPRYLYIPSLGFSVLLSFLILWISNLLRERGWKQRTVLTVLLLSWMIYSAVPYYFIQYQDYKNGEVKKDIIEQIQQLYSSFPQDSKIYIGVPAEKYKDLEYAIPQFYDTLVNVYTIPPNEYLPGPLGLTYRFEYSDGKLIEIANTP